VHRRLPSAPKSFSCKDEVLLGPRESPQNDLAEGRPDKTDSKADNWARMATIWGSGRGKTCFPSRDARAWFAALAKILLDEIERARAQLVRLEMVLTRRAEERRMGQCEECERLWKVYQRTTIEAVQLYGELRSITEDQGIEKLSGATTKAEAAERLHDEARQRLEEHLAATGHR